MWYTVYSFGLSYVRGSVQKYFILTGKGGFFKVKSNKSTKIVISERATVPGTWLLRCTVFDPAVSYDPE